ncbi:MAG: steroid 3-ketoacyl-CoA thiolase, partial [Halioglobus sp.]|nr:steroid 3-ketoacyl-CoA thiolase [Halioglobus sp.]
MREAVIVEAVRTPIARGKVGVGDLHDFHATQLLALSYQELIRRSGLEWADVDYLAAGCVTQAGEQAGNIARNAWLTLGKDYSAGGTTLDNQCGSAQTANHMISALIGSGSINIGIAAGVESMSRVGLGAN